MTLQKTKQIGGKENGKSISKRNIRSVSYG